MLIEKIEIIKTRMDITITEARLLTKEEAEALPERFRLYDNYWWTSTANTDYSNYAWRVNGGSGYLFDYDVDNEYAVRPALIFESDSLKVGDKFFFRDKEFEVIKEGLAFCTTDIGKSAFRANWKAEDANQYEVSDIKKSIDKWFKENAK